MSIQAIDLQDQQTYNAEKIASALTESGAFFVHNHSIPVDFVQEAFAQATSLFLGSEELLAEVAIGKSPNVRGYFLSEDIVSPVKSIETDPSIVRRKYQAYELGFVPNQPQEYPKSILLCENQWPTIPGFRKVFENYYGVAMHLGMNLANIVGELLDFDQDFLARHTRMPLSQMRILYYPGDPASLEQDALGGHTDYEFLTIICSSADGLEIQQQNGEWVSISAPDNALVVLAGDAVEAFSDGHLRAARHRVKRLSIDRMSIVFFFGLDYETIVAPTPKFLRMSHEQRFPSFRFGEHMVARCVANYPHLKRFAAESNLKIPFECGPRNPLNAIRAKYGL